MLLDQVGSMCLEKGLQGLELRGAGVQGSATCKKHDPKN